jgi:hypothetical protein
VAQDPEVQLALAEAGRLSIEELCLGGCSRMRTGSKVGIENKEK